MAYDVVRYADLEWEERPAHEGQEPRHAAALTDAAHMTESRARMWRYPAHTRGRRPSTRTRRRSSPLSAAR